jgi:PAS domain S-box-containing protein
MRKHLAHQRRLAAIVEASSNFVGFADAGLNVLYVNDAGRRMLGLADAPGASATCALRDLAPEEADRMEHEVLAAIREHGRWHGELRLRHRRIGAPIAVVCDAFRIEDAEEPAYVALVIRDITERRRTEDKLLGQTRILEMIATGAALPDVLDALALFIESQDDGARCGAFVVDPNRTHVAFGRGPSLPREYLALLEGASVAPPHIGAFSEAAYRGVAIPVPDIAGATNYAERWRELLLSVGLRAVRSTPILGSGGRVLGSFAIYYDHPRDPLPRDPGLIDLATHLAAIAIERRMTEDALVESTARLRRAQQAAQMADWTWDVAADAITAQGELEAVYGLPAEKMPQTATAFFERVPQEARQRFQAELVPMLSGEATRVDTEFPFSGEDGAIRWLASKAEVADRRPDGSAARVVGVNYDVTARRLAESTIRANEERLRLILDSAREYAIVTADPEGRITSWNRGAQRMLGFEASEIIGQSLSLLFTPEDRRAGIPQQEMSRALAECSAANERWHMRRDGSRFFASGFTLPLADGHVRGFLLIFRDRTDERRLQEEIERRNEELRAVLEAVPVAVWFTYDPDARGSRQPSGVRVAGRRPGCQYVHDRAARRAPAHPHLAQPRRGGPDRPAAAAGGARHRGLGRCAEGRDRGRHPARPAVQCGTAA